MKDENVTEGSITIRNSSKIGYLRQIVAKEDDITVMEILKRSLKELNDMEEKLFNYEMKMETATGEELNSLILKYSNLQEKFIQKDGYQMGKQK